MKDRPWARILVGLFLLLLVTGGFFLDQSWNRAICTEIFLIVVVLLALRETYGLFEAKGHKPAVGIGMAGAAVLLLLKDTQAAFTPEFLSGSPADLVAILLILVATSATSMRLADRERALGRIASTIAGFVYAAWLPSTALDLLRIPSAQPHAALRAAYFVVLVAKASDIGGYLVGTAMGRTKLIESVSPKKTVEGAIGGLVFSLAAGPLLARAFGIEAFSLTFGAVAGLTLGVAAQLGDLVESLLKRSAAVKDSAASGPIFGGFLDLLDSLVVALPVGFLIVRAHGL